MTTPYIAGTNQNIADANQNSSSGRVPDWREILAILMARAWIGLVVAAVVFCISFIQLKRAVPYYRSTAVLMVEAQAAKILNYQDVVSLSSRNLEYFNTVVNMLHSRPMMEQAIQRSGLADRPEFFPGMTSVVQKADAARQLASISPVEKSRLINVTVEHSNAQIASDLANAIARAYIQQDLDSRMSTSLRAVDWLQEKAGEYRQKLEQGLLQLQKYREDTESVSLENDQNIVIAKLAALNAALTGAQTERIDAESRWKAVQEQVDAGFPMAQIALQMQDEPELVEALSTWRTQQQQIVQLQQRYKPEFPELQEAIETEQALKKRFEEACKRAVYTLKARYETLMTREEGLKKALQAQEQLAFSLARQLVRYNDLKRNVEADQEIYQAMISRMKETSIVGTLPSETILLAEEARPASAPFKPQPRQMLLRGAVLGLALGAGLIFLLYYSDHRFRRHEEVERALGVPVLTALPFIAGETEHERGMICHLDQTSEVTEAFRTLRAITQVSPSIQNAKVFLVTSTQPGEGKSLISTNLAISFAQDGLKTLLIGADLRRPAFKHIFGLKELPPGLSEILKGKLSMQDALSLKMVSHLDVIAAGSIPSHPAELLGNSVMTDLMADARTIYDRIVIDSSPMMGVSDAMLLMRHVDGVLFVVRQGVTHSLGATHAMKKIRESGATCLGAVMNGVNLKSFTNYYYYRRYGGYAYQQYQSHPAEPAGK